MVTRLIYYAPDVLIFSNNDKVIYSYIICIKISLHFHFNKWIFRKFLFIYCEIINIFDEINERVYNFHTIDINAIGVYFLTCTSLNKNRSGKTFLIILLLTLLLLCK